MFKPQPVPDCHRPGALNEHIAVHRKGIVRYLQLTALLLLTAAIIYMGYRYTGGVDLRHEGPEKYILTDIYSLIMIPDEAGECQAAVGYRDKHVIGTFIAEPVKRMVCSEYYFRDRPEAKSYLAPIVLVRLSNSEYHWVLESQLSVPL
jgi:hypothetical protein